MEKSALEKAQKRNAGKTVESYLFSSDKERIVDLLMKMGFKSAVALKSAVDALVAEDVDLANSIIEGDDEIDAMESEIDLECLRSVAMRQPVREDLRFIFAVFKTIIDLERIGDQSVNVAKWVITLKKYPKTEINPAIIEMTDLAEAMLKDVLEAFKTSNGDACMEIYRRDDALDKKYTEVFNEFIERMASYKSGDTNIVRAVAGQMWIARHLERVGDHVTNIAERVYFMDKGETLSCHKPEPFKFPLG